MNAHRPTSYAAAAPSDVDASRERLEALARLMDSAIRIPGTNITLGADAALGLVPVIGNVATTAISAWLILEARRLGVSPFTQARMVGNVALDSLISAIPLIGNVGDVFFKANRKNIELLREHFRRAGDRAKPV